MTLQGSPSLVDDPARLAALRDTGLLDSGAEECFDRFTRLAREILRADVSLVSLVDGDRQYFKSQDGLEGEFAEAGQTPLSHSFCRFAVETGEPFVVDDVDADERVAGSLAPRDLHFGAYAGVPLTLPTGHTLGAFCVLTAEPRAWTEQDLRVMTGLASAVLTEIELRQALVEASLRDPLTGLSNRRSFGLLLQHALQAKVAGAHAELAVLSIGLDGFALVNEQLGHVGGDAVLRECADRLLAELRDGDVLCRFAGDQFLVLAHGVSDPGQAAQIAGRARTTIIQAPFRIAGEDHALSASVGIAMPGAAARTAEELVAEADAAMRQAKLLGRATMRLEQHDRRVLTESRLRLHSALDQAVEEGGIGVHYQPIVELDSGRAVAVEALARWTHAELGPISPAECIPIAERTGQIVALGEHVLREACRQLARWREERGDDFAVSVNLAPQQLELASLPDVVAAALADADLPPEALTLEITERAVLADRPVLRRTLARLHALGVRIALDDFGVGYSALGYLRRFPLDTLKLDRAFVEDIEHDPRGLELVRAIIQMAGALELEVVAEGIETASQAAQLCAAGCRYGQGFHFGRPQAPDAAL